MFLPITHCPLLSKTKILNSLIPQSEACWTHTSVCHRDQRHCLCLPWERILATFGGTGMEKDRQLQDILGVRQITEAKLNRGKVTNGIFCMVVYPYKACSG